MRGRNFKKRQLAILRALAGLGGKATTQEIAQKTNLNTNGVSQSLGALPDSYVTEISGGKAGQRKWQLTADARVVFSPSAQP
jgi:DNA-binding IclR family transcriptional regulator